MDDEEDQETPFQEMDAHQLAVETAWVRLFLREASTRGYTIEDVVALLDEPGMTVEAAVERMKQRTIATSENNPRPKGKIGRQEGRCRG